MAGFLSEVSLRSFLMFLIGLSVISFVVFGLYAVSDNNVDTTSRHVREVESQFKAMEGSQKRLRNVIEKIEQQRRNMSILIKGKQTNERSDAVNIRPNPDQSKPSPPNYNVHIFYYPWYKSKAVDGKYAHWNHEQMPHWSAKRHSRRRQYVPPDDIGANFYPMLGPYSSADPHVIDVHMQQVRATGVGVLSVSWYPPHYEKPQETSVDDLMMTLFDSAAKHGLKIAFHIEPYEQRSGETLHTVIKYIVNKYGNHSAFYRTNFRGKQIPVYYIYDSYQIDSGSWAQALKRGGKHSLRDTKFDGIFLGLLVEQKHLSHLAHSGFDGFYTYFAANGFSYGSSWKNWQALAKQAKTSNLTFVPSIGPGYLDTRVRTWNGQSTRLRLKGQYYRSSFYSAMAAKPKFLSITSFNEWHEGTQIEPAVPKVTKDFTYSDYRPRGPEFYLNMTGQFVKEYTANMSHPLHHHDNAL